MNHLRLEKIAEAPLHPRFRHDRRKHVIRLWRKLNLGRLYWRDQHPDWQWASDEIARGINPRGRAMFTSIDAIEAFLDRMMEIRGERL